MKADQFDDCLLPKNLTNNSMAIFGGTLLSWIALISIQQTFLTPPFLKDLSRLLSSLPRNKGLWLLAVTGPIMGKAVLGAFLKSPMSFL